MINIPLQKILNPSSKSMVPLTFLEQKLLIADGPPFTSLKCQSPTGRAAIDKYTKDRAVDSQLIERELGFRSHSMIYDQDGVKPFKRRKKRAICEWRLGFWISNFGLRSFLKTF